MYVILFDGVCNLCNAWVNRIIKADGKDIFRFASLQSNYASVKLAELNISDAEAMRSVLFIEDNKVWMQSDAVLRILYHLGGGYRILSYGQIFPRSIRNVVYNWVASNRYIWFGKREQCMMPTKQLQSKFLL